MSTTFRVDDVAAATTPVTTEPLSVRFPDALVLGLPADLPLVAPPSMDETGLPTDARGIHPLLAAVHIAFAEHRPLVLSPDVVWITIAQGVAQHVRLNAEQLRRRFVRHDARKELRVRAHSWQTPEDWTAIVAGFRTAMGEEIGAGIARALTCDFSTTTSVERTASEIVLMDAFSPYFDYTCVCVCGIPEITLRGTPEDWKAIRSRIDILSELDLSFWTSSLAPMADQWIRAAEGAPDSEFWRSIYKPKRAYGWKRITGWIARLFPYLKQGTSFTRRNGLLKYAIGEEPAGTNMFDVEGMVASDAPSGIASVRCKLEHAVTKATGRVLLEGGVLGVTSDREGRLEAQCGWLVRPEALTIRAVLERIRETPGVTLIPRPTAPSDVTPPMRDADLGAELNEIFDEITALHLFASERRWSIVAPAKDDHIVVRSTAWRRELEAVRVVTLYDGTFLARLLDAWEDRQPWVRMRTDAIGTEATGGFDPVTGLTRTPGTQAASSEDGALLPVVATSLAEILARALDTGGDADLPVLRALGAV